MPRRMDLTLILRDVPVKDDPTYQALHTLYPKRVIYTIDFGGRSFPKDRDISTHVKRIQAKLTATRDLIPFNGASEISPLLSSYIFAFPAGEMLRGEIVGEAFRLFPGIKEVYFDLGLDVRLDNAKALAEAFFKFNPDVKIGVIASLSDYAAHDSALLEWVNGNERLIACPFLSTSTSLEDGLKKSEEICGAQAEVFCAYISTEDAAKFKELVSASKLPLLVFWSAFTLNNISKEQLVVETKSSEDAKPADQFIEMAALYTSMVRASKSMDSELIGAIPASDVVKVRPYPPNGDGTSLGKVDLGHGKFGFVVLKHFNQVKFQETQTHGAHKQ